MLRILSLCLVSVLLLAAPSAYASGIIISQIRSQVKEHQTQSPRIDRGAGVMMETVKSHVEQAPAKSPQSPLEQWLQSLLGFPRE